MHDAEHKPRLAILFDAENLSAVHLDGIFRELKTYGLVSARRAYGEFSGRPDALWTTALVRHAITPVHRSAYGTAKNGADIALVIDAMDMLHSRRFDGFAIVTSDTDFMRLAIRIREQGLPVYVFGKHDTPERLRHAATRFFYVENLYRHASFNDPNSRKKPLQELRSALPFLREAVLSLTGTSDGWVPIDEVEAELHRSTTDFDPRTYGYRKLVDLLVAMRGVAVRRPQGEPARMLIVPKGTKRRKSIKKKDAARAEEGSADNGGD